MPDSPLEEDASLREALKRCSPATYYAACKYRKFRRTEDLRALLLGVVERFVDRDLRPVLQQRADSLRLREDLGIDSLTMMEVIMLAEEVLQISVSNEELTNLRTLGDVQSFILAKAAGLTRTVPGAELGKTVAGQVSRSSGFPRGA